MDQKLVTVNILGTSFAVRADEDPEYVASLVKYLSDKVDEIERTSTSQDPLRQAILAAILLTDELFKERDQNTAAPDSGESDEMLRITNRIIETLDQSLEE